MQFTAAGQSKARWEPNVVVPLWFPMAFAKQCLEKNIGLQSVQIEMISCKKLIVKKKGIVRKAKTTISTQNFIKRRNRIGKIIFKTLMSQREKGYLP